MTKKVLTRAGSSCIMEAVPDKREEHGMREILIGEHIRNHRTMQHLTQKELCEGICDVSTLSRLERGKQTPCRDTVNALLHRLGLPEDRIFVLVDENDLEIAALKRDIQADTIEFEKAAKEARPLIWERAMKKLEQLEKIIAEDDAINRQYILSARVTLGTAEGPYAPSQRRKLLEEAIRMTVPEFRPDRAEKFRYRLLERTLLNKLARTLSMEGKKEEAIDLYGRLLRNIEETAKHLEGYAAQFCLVAHNCAINLAAMGRYDEACKLAERGQEVGIRYGYYLFLPGFLATQAECRFFLGEREKSAELYLRAGCLLDVIGDRRNLEIIRKEMWERLEMELPF